MRFLPDGSPGAAGLGFPPPGARGRAGPAYPAAHGPGGDRRGGLSAGGFPHTAPAGQHPPACLRARRRSPHAPGAVFFHPHPGGRFLSVPLGRRGHGPGNQSLCSCSRGLLNRASVPTPGTTHFAAVVPGGRPGSGAHQPPPSHHHLPPGEPVGLCPGPPAGPLQPDGLAPGVNRL